MRGPLIALLLVCAVPGQARADDSWWGWAKKWLRSANSDVKRGNEKLVKGDHEGALKSYDAAARDLPANGGVHLNRGLALLEKGQLAEARQALSLATQPPASHEVRADAYYNLGSTFYAEGDVSAGEDDHESAQKSFREAADALRQSLRLKPGNRSAAWNLELALRRLNEEKQKQEEQEQQEQEENEENEEEQDGEQDPDGEPNEDGEQDPNEGDKPDEPKEEPKPPKPDEPNKDDKKTPEPQEPEQAKPEPLPDDARRALDALQDGEQNLERLRARQRAARERRRPSKDW